ncbi:hypothetical protein A2U01_0117849, partial [Trifolium medium]|nr:hypothetical protein [Trifolium medium]
MLEETKPLNRFTYARWI